MYGLLHTAVKLAAAVMRIDTAVIMDEKPISDPGVQPEVSKTKQYSRPLIWMPEIKKTGKGREEGCHFVVG